MVKKVACRNIWLSNILRRETLGEENGGGRRGLIKGEVEGNTDDLHSFFLSYVKRWISVGFMLLFVTSPKQLYSILIHTVVAQLH